MEYLQTYEGFFDIFKRKKKDSNKLPKFVFTDLDHTLIKPVKNSIFFDEDSNWTFIDRTLKLLKSKYKNFPIIIVTNQGGIEKGYITEESFKNRIKEVINKLKENDLDVYDYFYSKTYDRSDEYRKPNTQLIRDLEDDIGEFDLKNSVMLGDKEIDKEFAKNAKIGSFIDINNFKTYYRGSDY